MYGQQIIINPQHRYLWLKSLDKLLDEFFPTESGESVDWGALLQEDLDVDDKQFQGEDDEDEVLNVVVVTYW